ncbi:MAG: YbaN family protein [Roseibium sp.]
MRRTTFKLMGSGCVALGVVGAFLPLLPSTIFFIMAAGCFARSSPALEIRILEHPVFGPPVIAWRKHGAISRTSKFIAIAGMSFGYAMFYWSTAPSLWLAIIVAFVMLGCAFYVGSRPSGPKNIKSGTA